MRKRNEACACACLRNKAIDDLYNANNRIAELLGELDKLEANVNTPDYEKMATVRSELEIEKKKAN